jgi:hypothetical protein
MRQCTSHGGMSAEREAMESMMFRAPGTEATLRGVGAKVFWAYPTTVVQDAPALLALYLQAGAAGKNTENRPKPQQLLSPREIRVVDWTWDRTDVLMLIVPGEAFSIYLMWGTGTRCLDCWYINLQEPIRRTSIGFDTMDHMLDIVVSPDLSRWTWKDDDEFREAERIGWYSREQACSIRAQGERAVCLLRSERRSFYERWRGWRPNGKWEIPRLSPQWDRIDPDGIR